MVNGEARMRRRLLVEALDIQPRELRRALGLSSCQVSYLLNADRRLSRDELQKLMPLLQQRVRKLFR